MRYQDFIGELRSLVQTGESLRARAITHEDPKFREWRHRSESLVREAAAHGYRLPGKFRSDVRVYRAMYPGASFPANSTALEKELGDSLIELRFIIEQHEKYGEPVHTQLVAASAAPPPLPEPGSELTAPEKVTLAWLAKHVSVAFWFKVAALALGLVLLGAAVGRTTYFDPLVLWFKTNWPF